MDIAFYSLLNDHEEARARDKSLPLSQIEAISDLYYVRRKLFCSVDNASTYLEVSIRKILEESSNNIANNVNSHSFLLGMIALNSSSRKSGGKLYVLHQQIKDKLIDRAAEADDAEAQYELAPRYTRTRDNDGERNQSNDSGLVSECRSTWALPC
ncbi:MAG TPA: hypothetical protein VMW10_02630 [Alphaproteobacteria bacterium]|nr:hypothetical protein [Alphaproteobacteria bacterium]